MCAFCEQLNLRIRVKMQRQLKAQNEIIGYSTISVMADEEMKLLADKLMGLLEDEDGQ